MKNICKKLGTVNKFEFLNIKLLLTVPIVPIVPPSVSAFSNLKGNKGIKNKK